MGCRRATLGRLRRVLDGAGQHRCGQPTDRSRTGMRCQRAGAALRAPNAGLRHRRGWGGAPRRPPDRGRRRHPGARRRSPGRRTPARTGYARLPRRFRRPRGARGARQPFDIHPRRLRRAERATPCLRGRNRDRKHREPDLASRGRLSPAAHDQQLGASGDPRPSRGTGALHPRRDRTVLRRRVAGGSPGRPHRSPAHRSSPGMGPGRRW